jgi:hypothetical protein
LSDEITASIEAAAASIESAEAASSPEPSTPTTEQATESAVVAEGAQDPALAAEDTEDVVADRAGRIPLDRHKAVLTRHRREAETRQKELEAKLEGYKKYDDPVVGQKLAVAELIESNPELLLQVLRQDERYAKLLTPAQAAVVAEVAKEQAADDARPEPDLQTPDGMLIYSDKAQAKLDEWRERQFEKKLQAEFEKRLSPIEKERQEREKQVQSERLWQESLQTQRQVLTDARANWELFKESEGEIKAMLAKPGNERMSLERAYQLVVMPKIKADRESIRKDLIAEMNKATPQSTSLRPGAQSTVPPKTDQTTEDIIMAHARRLEGKAA